MDVQFAREIATSNMFDFGPSLSVVARLLVKGFFVDVDPNVEEFSLYCEAAI